MLIIVQNKINTFNTLKKIHGYMQFFLTRNIDPSNLPCLHLVMTFSYWFYFGNNFLNVQIKVFFCGEFSPLGDKNKSQANSTNEFLRIYIKNSPYFNKKNKFLDLDNVFHDVAIIRQKFKKDLQVHQDNHHLLLINVEDPRQYTNLRNLKKKTQLTQVLRTCHHLM